MKTNINKIELQGCIGSVRLSAFNGKNAARLSVATNYIYKSKEGEAVIETTWHSVTAWENGRGIKSLDTLKKGDCVHVRGRVRTIKYTDSEQVERTSYEVVATSIRLVKEEKNVENGTEVSSENNS